MSYDPTVVIVIAAGEGRRWGNFLDGPKHDLVIDGERLLDRTCRQLAQYPIDSHVVVRDGLHVPNTALPYYPILNDAYGDADKFQSSRPLWNTNGRTVILYGDVFFTDEAMEKIMMHPHPDWNLFGRIGPSSFTGKDHGECFGISFYHDFIPEFDAALRRVIRLYGDGTIDRNGGWEVYKAMIRLPDEVLFYDSRPLAGPRFTNIDDFTDDFDWPHDYETWVERWNSR